MARTSSHYATVAAAAWLRHQAGQLLVSDRVPKHLSKPLFMPEGELRARWLLLRTVMVLDLWRAWYRPLTDEQVLAYQLSSYVEMNSDQQPAEWRYIGQCCATCSAPRLRELYQELCLTGQVLVPRKQQLAGEHLPTPSPVEHALEATKRLSNDWLRPQPDILP